MKELEDTTIRAERSWLVGIQTDRVGKHEAESLLHELANLAATLGLEVVGTTSVRVRERNPALFLGTGKADEIVASAKGAEADSILFDHVLSPVQQRNWEELSGLKAYDRSELIIRIFAGRALTREASLQVELAELEYSIPRLAHSYSALSRQRGGRYGTKGKGEQKLELDRREIERRIHEIKEELKTVRTSRDTQRKRRERQAVPRAAVVGYTNAGKSSLLNALCDSGVVAEDKLFATLDPTTRRMAAGKGGSLLLTDTVGFVRNLPHGLVEAFKATLEEAALADLLVEVVDASDPESERHMETTNEVLREIGAGDIPRVVVLNKADLVDEATAIGLASRHPEALLASIKTGAGLEEIRAAVEAALVAKDEIASYRIPDAEYALVALLHREAQVLGESREDDATVVEARVPERVAKRLEKYLAT
ncbi:MAG TPA: GTPase HflX [Rectinemataceae bacterium]|nr:GTPase HflX [Rectinemataceae bacterium]